jgi:hypothetical protein
MYLVLEGMHTGWLRGRAFPPFGVILDEPGYIGQPMSPTHHITQNNSNKKINNFFFFYAYACFLFYLLVNLCYNWT